MFYFLFVFFFKKQKAIDLKFCNIIIFVFASNRVWRARRPAN